MKFLVPAILLLSAILLCDAEDDFQRPRRPEKFETAEQINNYLKELQEYYSVYGRGRYGKRQLHTSDAFRESPFFKHDLSDETSFKSFGYK